MEHAPSSSVVVVDASGCHEPALDEVSHLVGDGGFAWIDLEETGSTGLRRVADDLHLAADVVETLLRADRRPSFTALSDATYAALPVFDSAAPDPGSRAPYLCLALTDRFLVTRHGAPCPFLAELRSRRSADGPALFFDVLDALVRMAEPQLLELDERLNEIQVQLLTSTPSASRDETVGILRLLTESVQGLTWYSSDLQDAADDVRELPGMTAGSAQRLSRHRDRVASIADSARDYREEAKDALGQYAANVSDRQGRLINVLTVVSALFLPLTFLTGYFGMNLGPIVDLTTGWEYAVFGLLLPAVSVGATLLLLRMLTRRLGVGRFADRDEHGWGSPHGASGQLPASQPQEPQEPPERTVGEGRPS